MDFFQKHDKALRKGRLLQAATAIFAEAKGGSLGVTDRIEIAVSIAFQLEKQIEKELEFRE